MKGHKVYKAKVAAIESREDGKSEIYITPLQSFGDSGLKKPANPPSVAPTSQVGSGMISIPDPGTMCLVAESDEEYKVNILTYIHPDGFNPHGVLSGEPTSQGSFHLKAGGMNKSIFSMDRSGTMRLFSNQFAQLEISGTRKEFSVRSRRHSSEFAGGFYRVNYRQEDPDTSISDFVSHKQVYSKSLENPGYSDRESFETEVPVRPLPVAPYVDKAIVRAGSIKNLSRGEIMSHVYQLETRQNTFGNDMDKDTVTTLRLGHQNGFAKYGVDDHYPAGTLIDWSAKRNSPQDFFSFLMRAGKYGGDVKRSEPTQGEVFRQQIYYDKLDKTPYGTPSRDPVGDGKGYHYKLKDRDFGQQFTISYGKLTSTLASEEISGSISRTHLHDFDISGRGVEYTSIIGGKYLYKQDYRRKTQSSEQQMVELWDPADKYSKKWVWDEIQASMDFNKDGIITTFSASDDTSVEIYDAKIVIKTPRMRLELSDEKGLQLNGTPLVYGNFIEFFNKMKDQLVLGNMGSPAPLSPPAQGEHQSGYNAQFDASDSAFQTGTSN